MKWYRLAVEQDNAEAKWEFGSVMYNQGLGGVGADKPRTAELALKALAADSVSARDALIQTRASAFDGGLRRAIQQRLKSAGLYSGPIDGDFGPGTVSALERYAQVN